MCVLIAIIQPHFLHNPIKEYSGQAAQIAIRFCDNSLMDIHQSVSLGRHSLAEAYHAEPLQTHSRAPIESSDRLHF
jgi:hypothetical protein